MFSRVFLKQRTAPGLGLATYLDEVVLGGNGEPRSRVFVDGRGDVRGFIGIWPRRMMLDGRTIEAAAAGSLMVDRPEEHPTAGARLLRAFLAGPQQLSFSETANDVSQRMWERVGGERLATTSLDWVRVLRPAGFAVATAGYAYRAARLMRPAAVGIDKLIEAAGINHLLPDGDLGGFRDTDVTTPELLELIPALSHSYQLRPDWHSPNLSVLLSHAQTKERYGKLYRRAVYSRTGVPVACYLYYARRGDTARVLQVLALPEATSIALDSLFQHAATLGCVGVRGRADPVLFDALVSRRCLFYHGAAMVVHARDKALLDEVRGSRTLLTGLAGESWNRLIGGSFA
jgi:hypothetical protein